MPLLYPAPESDPRWITSRPLTEREWWIIRMIRALERAERRTQSVAGRLGESWGGGDPSTGWVRGRMAHPPPPPPTTGNPGWRPGSAM
jgi:hypothetical protein